MTGDPGTALIFVLKISSLTLLTQSLKYLAGITDFSPTEGAGRVPYKSDLVIIICKLLQKIENGHEIWLVLR